MGCYLLHNFHFHFYIKPGYKILHMDCEFEGKDSISAHIDLHIGYSFYHVTPEGLHMFFIGLQFTVVRFCGNDCGEADFYRI